MATRKTTSKTTSKAKGSAKAKATKAPSFVSRLIVPTRQGKLWAMATRVAQSWDQGVMPSMSDLDKIVSACIADGKAGQGTGRIEKDITGYLQTRGVPAVILQVLEGETKVRRLFPVELAKSA